METIVAIATAVGRGGLGVVRVSGDRSAFIAMAILGFKPKPRHAYYKSFKDISGDAIDKGIALFFSKPYSFTGEDVFELQGHGGPVVLDMIMQRCIALGARSARPGEFSERAFLNDKIDLTQAEAIADLINAESEAAARCALQSLQGLFSNKIQLLLDKLIYLRVHIESSIDFSEEEIDCLSDGKVKIMLNDLKSSIATVLQEAKQGAIIREGMNVVIIGRPNVGKSSLLNALAGNNYAIVTDIAGTTRDALKEHIHIGGMPIHIIDTAGLRYALDEVERIGIERTWLEINHADRVLLIMDSSTREDDPETLLNAIYSEQGLQKQACSLIENKRLTVIRNKADLSAESIGFNDQKDYPTITMSAKYNKGVEMLRNHLKCVMGYNSLSEGKFLARRRHIEALETAQQAILVGESQLLGTPGDELLAEDLRVAQQALSEITGKFSADDLLGEIFGSFCIGK